MLGTGKSLSNEQRLAKQEDIQTRRVMDGRIKGRRKRGQQEAIVEAASSSEDEGDVQSRPATSIPEPREEIMEFGDEQYESDHYSLPLGTTRDAPVVVVDDDGVAVGTASVKVAVKSVEVGSALKRAADGSVIAPRVVKGTRKGAKVCFLNHLHA